MRVGFSLGSNLGDRVANLKFGRDELCHRLEEENPVLSGIYETQPVNCPEGSASFLNAVIELETDLPPEQLLMVTQSIEAAAGRRPNSIVNAPRPLDIDILYSGNDSVETAVLKIPHPRLHERRFVLTPLAEIRPNLTLPSLPRICDLLRSLPDDEPEPVLLHQQW